MRKLLKKYGFVPDKLVTDDLRSYEPQPVILESQNAMNAVDGATIERKIRINRPDEGRGRCKGSRAWDPRKDFLGASSNTKYLQRPTSSYLNKNAPSLQGIGHADMARSRRCGVSLMCQEICYALYLAT